MLGLLLIVLLPIFGILSSATITIFGKDDFWTKEQERQKKKKSKIGVDRIDKQNISTKENQVYHFVFIVNGWMGVHKELAFLKHAFLNHPIVTSEKENETVIIHQTQCNEGLLATCDGIALGGQRVMKEILSFIENELQLRYDKTATKNIKKITISTVGGSLGGLYCRYAISKIYQELSLERQIGMGLKVYQNDSIIVPVEFNTYCSIVSPHLGLKANAFVSVFPFVEKFVASVTSQSGRDIFLYQSDIVYNMATCPTYLYPLSKFRKRILFANSYQTDFMVPLNTAAFLYNGNKNESHRVCWISNETETETTKESSPSYSNNIASSFENTIKKAKTSILKAVFETEATYEDDLDSTTDMELKKRKQSIKSPDSFTSVQGEMTTSLDRLGWTKFVLDPRPIIPFTFKLDKWRIFPINQSNYEVNLNTLICRKKESIHESFEDESPSCCYLSPQEISQTLSFPHHDHRYSFPNAHRLIVAGCRDKRTCIMFRAGRSICLDMVDEILSQISPPK